MNESSSSSEDVAALRRDVALANRIAHRIGLVNAFGHVSARVPGTETFLFPTRSSPALADPDRLLVLDVDGNILSGQGTPNTEFWIHARIYAARPDVGAVAHVHSPSCVAIGAIGQTVRIMHHSAAAFEAGVPVFERPGLIRSRELGDQVASTLGQATAMLLRGHGANLADVTVRRTIVKAQFLEEAAELQLRALAAAGGNPDALRVFNAEETARVREQIDSSGPLDRAWEYFSALVEGRV